MYAEHSFRQTRSGKKYSPCTEATQVNFDFGGLLLQAVSIEHSLENDDTEGYPFEPVTDSTISDVHLPSSSTKVLPQEPYIPKSGPSSHTHPSPPHPMPKYKHGSTEDLRRKKQGNAKRAIKRKLQKQAAPYGEYLVKPKAINRHVRQAQPVKTDLQSDGLPHTKNAYTGGRITGMHKETFALQDLIGDGSRFNFQLVEWDGCSSKPIIDQHDRVVVLCASPPEGSWDAAHTEAAEAIERAQCAMHFAKKDLQHRRGQYPAASVGASFGGGQKVPGNLVNSVINTAILASLLANPSIIRIAGFASAVFKTWSPKLYGYYVDHLGPLYAKYPTLKRNFVNSVFACATFNFGPLTWTYEHTDQGNLPFGWCAVTALGKYNPKHGGHLVLWDLKLVIEFPPGCTILLPSASLRHSNIAIHEGETRYSFTQYTAGGLFRWVDQGFQPSSAYRAQLSKKEKVVEKNRAEQRWKMGVDLFSTLPSLQKQPNFDLVG